MNQNVDSGAEVIMEIIIWFLKSVKILLKISIDDQNGFWAQ